MGDLFMKCKKLDGNLLDKDKVTELTEFLKEFNKQCKYECYTAYQHMRLRTRALNCWDRTPPVEVQRKRLEIIKDLKGE